MNSFDTRDARRDLAQLRADALEAMADLDAAIDRVTRLRHLIADARDDLADFGREWNESPIRNRKRMGR